MNQHRLQEHFDPEDSQKYYLLILMQVRLLIMNLVLSLFVFLLFWKFQLLIKISN